MAGRIDPRTRSRGNLNVSVAVSLAAIAVLVASLMMVIRTNGGLSARGVRGTAFGHGPNGEIGEGDEILTIAREQALIRTLPSGASADLSPARLQALRDASSLGSSGGAWSEVQQVPYDSDDPNWRDPVISNSGGGSGLVTGRMTALAIDGRTVYAGGADGGVWRSTDGGDSWTPITDHLASLSSGSLAVNPADHSVWYGTGEANTAFENYLGTGIYRSGDGGDTWQRIGGGQLAGQMVARITFDGQGKVYAATSAGVFRRNVGAPASEAWTPVLQPGTAGPYGFRYTNDVQVQPGTRGQVVIANVAWRGGRTDYNGFYVSRDGGGADTWHRVHTKGISTNDIGRTEFAYSADGSRLYAVVESIQKYNYNANTAMMGVYLSRSGNVEGPWRRRANAGKLAGSPGSALNMGEGYGPGIQIWYNNFIGVDPADPRHVYLGLEEVYESRSGGHSWTAVGPYWNFGLPCGAEDLDNCPKTTHPDQHVVAFGQGQVWIGNDGGIYSRDLQDATGWHNHNAGLRTLQYYYGGVGTVRGGLAYSGGLQDNGGSLLLPGAGTMVSPFGGDGGDVIVDPDDGLRIVHEYVGLDMWSTENGGRTDGSETAFREISPACGAFTYTPDPCDPNPRFIAPFTADPADIDHWVAGGQYVWETTKGWDTECGSDACDWQIVHDTGGGNQVTAVAVTGDTIYAGWCAAGCNADPGFATGIDTNVGGTWHTVAGPDVSYSGDALPQRYVFNLTVDPEDGEHVYAMFSGYSRRWIPGGGVGHVFESTDGGESWIDISGNLPDAPADDLVIAGDTLVLSTDVGVFITDTADPGTWEGFGSGLPNAIPGDLTVTPDGGTLVAVTHGRGMWQIPMP